MDLIAAVFAKIGEWLLSKLSAFVAAAIQTAIRRKKIDDASGDSVQPLKDAKTGDEIDKASDSALDNW